MIAAISTALIGALICVIGAVNMTGNISSLHSYHRSRVKEEDVKPFGRLVGLGTVICGASVILYSVLLLVAILTVADIYASVGAGLLIAGLAVGMIISFYAMKKYNGGIF